MDCFAVQQFIQAYVDGEFDEDDRILIVAHLQSCDACKKVAHFEQDFKMLVKHSDQPESAPPWLANRIRSALVAAQQPEKRVLQILRWAIPAAVALVLALGATFSTRKELPAEATLAEQSIEWHRRNIPMDVTGSSPEMIRRFFADKVPFAVRPPIFNKAHSELTGARLANLREHQAAFLSYQIKGRRVSVFIFDSDVLPQGPRVPRREHRSIHWHNLRGYNVAMFVSGGTGYAVASDMDTQRLIGLISNSQ